MDAELYQRAKQLCLELVEIPEAERASFIEKQCGTDLVLRSEVESLLASFDTDTDNFLDALEVNERLGSDLQSDVLFQVDRALQKKPVLEQRSSSGQLFAGRYRIMDRLGSGGMGEVWSALDEVLGEVVALKRIRRRALGNGGRAGLDLLLGEASAARRVIHPSVCRVHDAGVIGEEVFLTMEVIEGGDLRERLLRDGALAPQTARKLCVDLCAALAAVHRAGLLHRDLKPANVLFTKDGLACISDFGLAVELGRTSDRDRRSGTGCYMAPEVLAGAAPTEASDIYALGLVMYEALWGRRCFRSAAAIREAAERGELPPNPSGNEKSPDPVLERIVMACLAIDPLGRPQSADLITSVLSVEDPIEAVFALGQEPGPNIIAIGRTSGRLSFRGLRLASLGVLGLLALLLLVAGLGAGRQVTLEEAALEARALLTELGATPLVDAHTYSSFTDLSEALPGQGWVPDAPQDTGRALSFWYRESTTPQSPERWLSLVLASGRVTHFDPPLKGRGMTSVLMDPDGLLLGYFSGERPGPVVAGWESLFRAAGLDTSDFEEDHPAVLGSSEQRTKFRWKDKVSGQKVIRAGQVGGRASYFEVVRRTASSEGSSGALQLFLGVGLLALVIPLAARQVRLGRSSLGESFRLMRMVFVCASLAWVLSAHFPSDNILRALFMLLGLLLGVGVAAAVGVFYLALENSTRRRWPHLLISWSRFLRADYRDRLVLSHILLGVLFGLCLALGHNLLELTRQVPMQQTELSGHGFIDLLSTLFAAWPGGVVLCFELLAGLTILRAVTRNGRVSVVVLYVLAALIGASDPGEPIAIAMGVVGSLLSVAVLLRYGLLTNAVMFATAGLFVACGSIASLSLSQATPLLTATALLGGLGLVMLYLANSESPGAVSENMIEPRSSSSI